MYHPGLNLFKVNITKIARVSLIWNGLNDFQGISLKKGTV